MTFHNLYKKLSQLYPDSLRADWDNDGIMCADSLEKEVHSVLISLDVTSDVISYAIDNNFDTIISHHPLVFHSQKSLNPTSYTQAKLIELIKNGINVMSFHTRLDSAEGGVNDTLCDILELQNVQIDPEESIGRIGDFDEEMELPAFAELVKDLLCAPFVLFSGARAVKRVYVVGGDGKDLIDRAISLGADTLLTGRASYNTAIDAEDMGLNIVEAGHFYTENPVCASIEDDVLLIDPEIRTEIYHSNKIKFI